MTTIKGGQMDFKKVSQIIWMILAFLFIVVSFLRFKSENIYIDRMGTGENAAYIKVNKITGTIYGIDWSEEKNYEKWIKLNK